MPRLISYACLAFWLAAGRVAGQEYDYVVVGSGPGGGPLAVDLAKSGSSVLLLEAGPDLLDDPAHYAATYGDIGAAPAAVNSPNSRWDFFVKHSDDPARELRYRRTTWRAPDGSLHVRGGGGPDDDDGDDDDDPPEEGARPLGIWYPRASALGGGAMTGDAVLELPPDDTWDRIADATGDRSWAADEMRNIYAEIEAAHYVPNGTRGHGFAGWLETNRAGDAWVGEDAEATAMLRAMLGRLPGAPANVSADDDDLRAQLRRDINAPRGDDDDDDDDDGGATTTTGVFGVVAHADARGRRSSPAHYIRRALAEDPDLPLFVETNATVTGIVWDPLSSGGPPAVMAVNYVVGPGAYGADPRHGNDDAATATPAFTYVAKELILAAGVFNSPQILMASGVGPARALRALGIPVVADVPGVGANLGDVYEGSVASVAGLSGFLSSSLSSSSSRSGSIGSYSVQMRTSVSDGGADVVLWPAPYGFDGYWPGYLTHDSDDDDDKANTSSSTIAFALKSPHSARGTVTLRSADPLDPPEVNFRFFEDGAERDLQALLEALEVAGGVLFSSSSSSSAEEAKEALKTQAYSRSATGTCALGDTAADPMAVVDAAFRVRGVDRLRVVDASVFPRPPGAFPVLATYMISRKAARAILEDGWRWG
ncbi:putative alcohol dehydrogenase [Rosellinia necatrix]|uniref:Putative alcohol dehydrogenase n=1 Tax=Rosellinia necatrix TaxID=77044 RepID=A0A1S7UPW7_ROSNE|nr:putative alcohol dehydrogenase [Rosellinia necatrix]